MKMHEMRPSRVDGITVVADSLQSTKGRSEICRILSESWGMATPASLSLTSSRVLPRSACVAHAACTFIIRSRHYFPFKTTITFEFIFSPTPNRRHTETQAIANRTCTYSVPNKQSNTMYTDVDALFNNLNVPEHPHCHRQVRQVVHAREAQNGDNICVFT